MLPAVLFPRGSVDDPTSSSTESAEEKSSTFQTLLAISLIAILVSLIIAIICYARSRVYWASSRPLLGSFLNRARVFPGWDVTNKRHRPDPQSSELSDVRQARDAGPVNSLAAGNTATYPGCAPAHLPPVYGSWKYNRKPR